MVSIRDQIEQLTNLNLQPRLPDEDPEDDGSATLLHLGKGSALGLDDVEDDARGSSLRIENANTEFGKAYQGIKVSRRNSGNESSDNEEVVDTEFMGDYFHDGSVSENDGQDEVVDDDDDMKSLDGSYDDDGDDDEGSASVDNSAIDLVNAKISSDSEIEKGKAVCSQLAILDRLLELRIKLQNPLHSSNRYPQNESIKRFQNICPKFSDERATLKSKLVQTLEKLILIQKNLLEMKQPKSQLADNESDEELEDDIDVEQGEDLERKEVHDDTVKRNNVEDPKSLQHQRPQKQSASHFEVEVASLHSNVRSCVDPVINKWDGKARLAYGKDTRKGFSSFDRSTLSQVNRIMLDKKRLLKRTKLKRSTYRTLGLKPKEPSNVTEKEQDDADLHLKNFDDQIYDDDDFYHQLLKEFIGRSTSGLNDPNAVGRKWLDIQNLKSKSKKTTETKASKGRKIRYNVHSKLLNFMAPISVRSLNDQSRNDLFKSLFGSKGL